MRLSSINGKSTRECGQHAETIAKDYLLDNGLAFITQNFYNRQGEIDLIMCEQNTYVFVEVKYRKNNSFGGAISAISASKQQKIRQCATFYLQQQQLNEYNTPCRFDAVIIEGNLITPQISWLKNAF